MPFTSRKWKKTSGTAGVGIWFDGSGSAGQLGSSGHAGPTLAL